MGYHRALLYENVHHLRCGPGLGGLESGHFMNPPALSPFLSLLDIILSDAQVPGKALAVHTCHSLCIQTPICLKHNAHGSSVSILVGCS